MYQQQDYGLSLFPRPGVSVGSMQTLLFTSFPHASVSIVLSLLLANVNKQQRTYPDGVHILASDFNHAWLKSVPPNFVQHVNCTSRGQ